MLVFNFLFDELYRIIEEYFHHHLVFFDVALRFFDVLKYLVCLVFLERGDFVLLRNSIAQREYSSLDALYGFLVGCG